MFSDWKRTCHVLKLISSLGRTKLTNSPRKRVELARDQVVQLWNSNKIQAYNFYAVMAAKWFQTRIEDKIEQLLRDKRSKSTMKF